jgi:hypothetical protein
VKRRRAIPQALLRLRSLRIFEAAGTSQRPRRLARAVRRLRETVIGILPGARDIDAANDSEK